jgi:hypothetical protein
MSSNAIGSLHLNFLHSTTHIGVRGTGSTTNGNSSRLSGAGETSLSRTSDSGQLSPFAQLVSTLQGLQQSNPGEYQQLTERIGTNLEVAAQTAQANGNTTSANQLNLLASDFTNASINGQLPNLKDLAQAIAGSQHHYHHSEEAAVGSPASSSSTSGATAASNSSTAAASSVSTVPTPSVAAVTSSTSAVDSSSTAGNTSSSTSSTGTVPTALTSNSTTVAASSTNSKVGSSNSLSALLTSLRSVLSQLQQFLSSSQSSATPNNDQSLNPLSIILGTLSSAGVNGG